MLSVTQRLKTISQPQNGYVPKELFTFERYEDNKTLKPIKTSLSSIQGLAVDYLVRYILSGDKLKSFDISIKGAEVVDNAYETDDAKKNVLFLLDGITGLNRKSIINICKIVCYDVAYRTGLKLYQPPDKVSFEENLYDNVQILTERALILLKNVGSIVNDGFTFDGGYTNLVSSGDGDYLTVDTLIDLKTSKSDFSTKWSLQLLMYYILGIHSIHSDFQTIKKLCIVNPYLNQYCICNINDISDETKYKVSHNVLGYNMVNPCYSNDTSNYDYSGWRDVSGSDNLVLKEFLDLQLKNTGFDVEKYGNGIFDITVDDYWSFVIGRYSEYRPLFKNTKSVKLIKHGKYFMFISVSPKGKHSLLHGARLHSLEYSLEYYYDKMQEYAEAVISRFSKYWNALEMISKQVKSIRPSEKYLRAEYSNYIRQYKKISYKSWYDMYGYKYHRPVGYIHGCIIDIDFYNHIYVNPYDGTITPYYAISMDDKDVFDNTKSLLAVKRPDLLESALDLIENKPETYSTDLIVDNTITSLISKNDIINTESVKEFSRDIYTISNRIKPLKDIPDIGWIQVWHNNILNENNLLLEDKYKIKKSINKADFYLNKSYKQKGNKIAVVIAYRNYEHVDVRFEDGYIMTNIRMDRIKRGTLVHPDIKK